VKYLLDTNVVSELRSRRGAAQVRAWVDAQSALDLAISVVTLIEIETGILRLARRDPAQAKLLDSWFTDRLLPAFAYRTLPIDLAVARRVAVLHVPDPAPKHDALIAGTALANDLIVVTRNTADFQRTGVEVLDPWRQ